METDPMHANADTNTPEATVAINPAELNRIIAAAVSQALQTIQPTGQAGRRDGNKPPLPPKVGYTMKEVCAVSGVGRTTIYLALRRGELRSLKKGRRRIVLHRDLTRWLEGSLPPSKSEPKAPRRWRRQVVLCARSQFSIARQASKLHCVFGGS